MPCRYFDLNEKILTLSRGGVGLLGSEGARQEESDEVDRRGVTALILIFIELHVYIHVKR